MANNYVEQVIGTVTAYGYAKKNGYAGTEAEFGEELAACGNNARLVSETAAAVSGEADRAAAARGGAESAARRAEAAAAALPESVSDWLAAHISVPEGVAIDSSLSVAGAAADAAAAGTELDKRFRLGSLLAAGADLNELRSFGAYRFSSSRLPLNCPTAGSGFVLYFGAENTEGNAAQMVVNNVGNIWVRWLNASNEWSSWRHLAMAADLDDCYRFRDFIGSGTDLNALRTVGVYHWLSTGVPANSPTAGAGMVIYSGDRDADANASQIVVNSAGHMWLRWLTLADGWTSWRQLAMRSDIEGLPGTASIVHVASFDNVTALAEQTDNTICRITNLKAAEDGEEVAAGMITDFPEGVDLSDGTVAWLHTYGSVNRQQLLYYPSNEAVYQRMYHAAQDRWTNWTGGPTGRKMNILVIGNSFNQDVMAYVPPILKEIAPDVDFTVAVLYAGSADLERHLTMWNEDGSYALNLWRPSSRRWGRWNARKLREVLAMADWDVILTQAASSDVLSDERIRAKILTPGRQLLRILQENAPKPFRAGWFQWAARPEGDFSSAQMAQKIMDATDTVMQKLGFFDYIPVCAAIQSARTNQSLAALGGGGDMLHSDRVHLAAGLPDLIAAYTVAMKLAEWSGKGRPGVLGSDFVPTYTRALSIKASYADVQPGDTVLMTHGAPVGVTTTNYLGNKDTAAELPASGNTELDMWYAKDTKLAYVWNGTAWEAWDDTDCSQYVLQENIRAAQEIAELAVRNPRAVTDCASVLEA